MHYSISKKTSYEPKRLAIFLSKEYLVQVVVLSFNKVNNQFVVRWMLEEIFRVLSLK